MQASGQRINLEKTEITCSSNVTEAKKKEIADCLGVKAVEKHTKYLGLPTFIGRSKKEVFRVLVDRVNQKMKDWKEKSLSQAGREVLIKAVIQAIPSYSMNCFLIPLTICQEIERATARFFWGSSLEDRKCHWAGWDILTTAKANGGIGFRELHYFNLAMLAKQVWSLCQHPNSLAFKILKAKYFPRQELLQASVGHKPSYLWRSLHAAGELVKEGRAWRIGDGKRTPITERWIGVDSQIKPSGVGIAEMGECTVDLLIDNQSMRWKTEFLNALFTPEEAGRIKEIPLSSRKEADKQVWRLTPHGLFTVKSAYHLAVGMYSRLHMVRASTSIIPVEWKKMWQLDVPPRVRMLLWKACKDALPTKRNLQRRGCDIDPICTLCGEEEESTNHLFLNCKRSVRCWYTSMLRIDMNVESATSFQDFAWKKVLQCPPEVAELIAFMAWEIWTARCKSCMEGKPFSEREVVSNAQLQWHNYKDCKERVQSGGEQVKRRAATKWMKPPPNTMKLNCDVAILKEGRVGLGFVIRDDQANIVLAGKTSETAVGSSTLLEGYAMRFAMQMAARYGHKIDTVESDCINLVKAVNGKQNPPKYCDIIIGDIWSTAAELQCKQFKYIPRELNRVAHFAAKGEEFLSIHHTPIHLRQYVMEDR